MAGAFLLNVQRDEKVTVPAMLRAFVREKGALWMLVVVVCWSITPPVDKLAFQRASVPAHAAVLCCGVALAMLGVLVAQRRVGELRQLARAPWIYLGALAVSTVALGVQFLAYGVMAVAFVETLKRGVGNVMALVWGRGLFGEAVGTAQVVAVALMGVGVGLILI